MRNRSVVEWPSGLTVHKPEKCFPGFTIFHLDGNTYLLDMEGEICHVWGGSSPDLKYLTETQRLLCGIGGKSAISLIRNFTAAACASTVAELHWEGDIAWRYDLEPGVELHHDLVRMANGNNLLLLRRWVEAPAGWPDYVEAESPWFVIPQERDYDKPVLDDFIREVDSSGKTVWEWHTAENFLEFGFTGEQSALVARSAANWLHTNSIELMPDGNILTSFRQTNTIAVIERSSGRMIWRWGAQDGGLVGQHHPNVVPEGCPGQGNILIYDNGGAGGYPRRTRDYTRLLEINPQNGEIMWEYVNLPKNWVRTHRDSQTMMHHIRRFHSPAWGSVQRLPNGNTLTIDGAGSRIFEITHDGEIVWEYISPFVSATVVPGQEGGILDGSGAGRPTMPGVPFHLDSSDHRPQPRQRMAAYWSNIYRAYRIPYDDAPRAAHG